MDTGPVERPVLSVLRRAAPPEPWPWFCGYCGASHPGTDPPPMIERVCVSCGFGLLVEAPGPIAPSPDDAFLVVNHELVIQSVGRRAEQLLNVGESFVVGRELTELLLPIDCERDGAGALSDAVFDAASGDPMPVITRLVLCPAHQPGLRLRARIGRCGPPRAALLVLEQIESERVHAVPS